MADAELFAEYRRALETVADLCRTSVEDVIAQMAGMTPQQQAAHLLSRYPEALARFGTMSADVAREYYQRARAAYLADGGEADGYEAQAAQTVQAGWAVEDVSDAAGGEHGLSVAALPGKAVKRVMERADQTIIQNASRDPARPKWAVVPHPGACAWCVMVGSRGFVYRSALTSDAQRHSSCKCAIAVEFDTTDPRLDGYDPDALYELYQTDLASGIVTSSGSSIGSIGMASGGSGGDGTTAASRMRAKVAARASAASNRQRRQALSDYTNDTIVLFDSVRDVGQLDAAAKDVERSLKANGPQLTDRQLTGIRNAYRRARIRLGVPDA